MVYRLAKQIYADDITGIGAELAGGRWNHKGTSALINKYASIFL